MENSKYTILYRGNPNNRRYIALDNKAYVKSVIPKELLDELMVTKCHIPTKLTTYSRGKTVASDILAYYLSQYVFCGVDEDFSTLNEYSQWLSTSKDINEKKFIGYVFTTKETHYLRKVEYIPRIGPVSKPALKCPSPKYVTIDHTFDGKTWVPLIEEPILCKEADFFETVTIDFGTAIDIPAKGYRLVIHEWYQGIEEDMYTGLYRLKFITEPADTIFVPYKECEYENSCYGLLKVGMEHSQNVLDAEKLILKIHEDKKQEEQAKLEEVTHTTNQKKTTKKKEKKQKDIQQVEEVVKKEVEVKQEVPVKQVKEKKKTKSITKPKVIKKESSLETEIIYKSTESFISKYDGIFIDTKEYDKVKFDIVLSNKDSKYVDLFMKDESILYLNNKDNHGTLVVNSNSSFIKFTLENRDTLIDSFTLTKDSPSVLLYRNGNIITISTI